MNALAKLCFLFVLACSFQARAQEIGQIIERPVAICLSKPDIVEVAEAEQLGNGDQTWLQKQEDMRCGMVRTFPWRVVLVLGEYQDRHEKTIYVVQVELLLRHGTKVAFALLGNKPAQYHGV